MKSYTLGSMKGGWFVGDFEPNCLRSPDCEVACQSFHAGQYEPTHVHKVAREITVVVSGHACMAGQELRAGDILMLEPGEPADFKALEDTKTVVVKVPSVIGDKYFV